MLKEMWMWHTPSFQEEKVGDDVAVDYMMMLRIMASQVIAMKQQRSELLLYSNCFQMGSTYLSMYVASGRCVI
jgi:hypothetical protein